MDEKKMHYLIKIAELQSVTEASQQLFISQPALSQVIRAVEDMYQVKIFLRKNGRLQLTPAGEILIQGFQQQVRLEENMTRALNDVKEEQTGMISIGLSHARALQFLPVVLPEFIQTYPKIILNINTNATRGLETIVCDGKLDFAVVMDSAVISPALKEQLHYEPLFRYYTLLAVPPSHPIAQETNGIFDWTKRPPIDLSRVRNEPFIRLAPGNRTFNVSQSLFAAYGFEPFNRIIVSDEALTCRLVESNLGFALLQEHHALTYKKGAFFRIDHPNACSNLCLIYRKDTYLSKPAQLFIHLIRHHASLGTWQHPEL